MKNINPKLLGKRPPTTGWRHSLNLQPQLISVTNFHQHGISLIINLISNIKGLRTCQTEKAR